MRKANLSVTSATKNHCLFMWNTRSSGEAIPTPDSCIASPAGSVPLSYDLDLGPLLRLNRMIAAEKDCRGLWLAADAGTDASSVVTLGRLWSATGCEVSSQLLMMLLGIGMSSFHRYCVHTILKKQEFTQSSITSHCRRLLSFSFDLILRLCALRYWRCVVPTTNS